MTVNLSHNILVINCGSSSLKFAVIDPESTQVLIQGIAERLNSPDALLKVQPLGSQAIPYINHAKAMAAILASLGDIPIAGIGHRVVHGGEFFSASVLLNEDAVAKIDACRALAPLHNPAHVTGIRAAMENFPELPHVAVFDTAFHQTMPPHAYFYALPYDLYKTHQVRRYGFHGTSHRFVAEQAATLLDKPFTELQIITAHLGNGCSACAIKNGQSMDTTMGLTPLEGLAMGTRSGDVDPNLIQFLVEQTGRDIRQVTDLLNRDSGLLGLSGLSNDMRTLLEAADNGHSRAELAIDVFCYRLAKGILGLAAALDRIDALIFTGGIGENSAPIRARTLAHLKVLKPTLDHDLNSAHGRHTAGRITTTDSALTALVVPTNEELVIARETQRLLQP
ncbi:acetate kinase [Phragmitibacter flavus]|uniref:acetate kinase n=1 Tax=Phragmitibacter flavus TaxID=2576071 RepID=UPI001F104023|nr:acetate kinase [Phragmitibacter flavus]